jgi:hypothetical protein
MLTTAGSLELADSSSAKLIEQLNHKAKMFNPAWIFYIAAPVECALL